MEEMKMISDSEQAKKSQNDQFKEIQQELRKLLQSHKNDKNINFFIVTDKQFFIAENGCWTDINYFDVKRVVNFTNKIDRGKILNFFSKIECIVNFVLKFHFLSPDLSKSHDFDLILDRLSLNDSVNILRKIKLINKTTSGSLVNLIGVRNSFAHQWNEKKILYNEKMISQRENFDLFKDDCEKVYIDLVNTCNKIQRSTNYIEYLENLIARLKEL